MARHEVRIDIDDGGELPGGSRRRRRSAEADYINRQNPPFGPAGPMPHGSTEPVRPTTSSQTTSRGNVQPRLVSDYVEFLRSTVSILRQSGLISFRVERSIRALSETVDDFGDQVHRFVRSAIDFKDSITSFFRPKAATVVPTVPQPTAPRPIGIGHTVMPRLGHTSYQARYRKFTPSFGWRPKPSRKPRSQWRDRRGRMTSGSGRTPDRYRIGPPKPPPSGPPRGLIVYPAGPTPPSGGPNWTSPPPPGGPSGGGSGGPGGSPPFGPAGPMPGGPGGSGRGFPPWAVSLAVNILTQAVALPFTKFAAYTIGKAIENMGKGIGGGIESTLNPAMPTTLGASGSSAKGVGGTVKGSSLAVGMAVGMATGNPILGVLATIGLSAVGDSLKAMGDIAKRTDESLTQLVRSMSGFSAEVTTANVRVQLRRFQERMTLARRVGPDLARVETTRNQNMELYGELKQEFMIPLLRFTEAMALILNLIMRIIRPFFTIVAAILLLISNIILYIFRFIVENTKTIQLIAYLIGRAVRFLTFKWGDDSKKRTYADIARDNFFGLSASADAARRGRKAEDLKRPRS